MTDRYEETRAIILGEGLDDSCDDVLADYEHMMCSNYDQSMVDQLKYLGNGRPQQNK